MRTPTGRSMRIQTGPPVMMENAVSKRQAAGDDGRHFISTVLLPGAHNKAIALLARDKPS